MGFITTLKRWFNMIFKKYAVLETDSQIGYFFKLT